MQVNTNGVLSFRYPFSLTYTFPFPLLLGQTDSLIAAFWGNFDYTEDGQVYYRFSEDVELLNEVGTNISAAFEINFQPSWLFITTWNEVAVLNLIIPSSLVNK